MHPIPSLKHLRWLIDDRLDSVVTAEFCISFKFDSGGLARSEVTATLIYPDGAREAYDPQTRDGAWSFQRLIGRTVGKLSRPDDLTIEITFNEAATLRLISERGPYESGSIISPTGSSIIF